jgi:phospholipid/cholesterol/gamma-HCH transport system permease protein
MVMAATASATASAQAPVPSLPFWLGPIAWVGSTMIGFLAYFGGLAVLMLSAAVSLVSFSRDDDAPGFWETLRSELGWLLFAGVPLVGLVHVGMGSFLSMQAYFGSTFVDGTGAVVGVGLLRNVASLVTGMTLSGLIACRIIPQRLGTSRQLDESAGATRRGRAVIDQPRDAVSLPLDPGRLTAPRLVACGLATMLLSLWGFVVGTFIGWQAAGTLMGLSTNTFFLYFYRMIWFRDVVVWIVKGLCFGLLTAAICCFESFRAGGRHGGETSVGGAANREAGTADLAGPIVRAASLSIVAILILNMTWFILIYHAVPVYGPSLLLPPSP